MKRIALILTLTATQHLAHAQQQFTQEQILEINAAIASEQLAIQQQQLDELRAIRQQQKEAWQQAQEPYNSGLPWLKPGCQFPR